MGENLGVLEFKISVLRQKLFIVCPTRAGVIISVFVCRISVLRQKLVIIFATRFGIDFGVLAV